jgi:hypothetical protein
VRSQPSGSLGLPVAQGMPTVGPQNVEGQTITSTDSTWIGSPTFTRQWQRCNAAGANCVNIASATNTTYRLASADVGFTVRIQVTATNPDGSATAVSAPSAVIRMAPPTVVSPPTISSQRVERLTVTATNATWTGRPTVRYQWQALQLLGTGCNNISGATATTYRLVAADIGNTVRVQVTGTNAGGSAVGTSSPSAEIYAAAPVATGAPWITGAAPGNFWYPNGPSGGYWDGHTLYANGGSFTSSVPFTITYTWHYCTAVGGCTGISSGSGTAFGPQYQGDCGRSFIVTAHARNNAYGRLGGNSASSVQSPVVTCGW